MRKNSIKNTRINSEVQRELSSIISRELEGMIDDYYLEDVSAEDLSAPSLQNALIYGIRRK